MRLTRTLAAAGLAAVLVLGAGCGSDDGDDAAESGTTAPTTADGGADAGTDAGTDSGSSAGAEEVALPDGWPDELALPDGVTPIQANALESMMSVVANIDGDVQAVFDALKAQLTEAGYEIVADNFTGTDDGGYGSLSGQTDELTVAIAFGPDATGDVNQVTINVADA